MFYRKYVQQDDIFWTYLTSNLSFEADKGYIMIYNEQNRNSHVFSY